MGAHGDFLAGILAMAIATWQYELMIRYLWSDDFEAIRGIVTPLLAVAIALIVIGVFALVAVNLRLR